jgi:UDP-glucose 4-epimerase|tara:strand:- start:342 stop:1202 length:861 start_codon:yes stop_codon:yes gene_type:complete
VKKIGVFGGSGFLASHISEQLTNEGYDVTIIDLVKPKNLLKKQKFINANILDKKKITKILNKINVVYHFAGIADIDKANKFPFLALNTNILGTINIMEACIYNKVKKVIFASSVYALSEKGGFYSTSKLTSEMIIEQYSNKYNIKYNILRFGSLYGLRSNHFNSLGKYVSQAKKNKKIIRYSDGNETRNYINVLDAANLCIRIIQKKYENKYFDLIGRKEFKVKNVLKIIAKLSKIKDIIYKKKIYEHHYKINPYTYKLRKGISLKPKKEINIEEGIKQIINEADI